jgi:hypothetical protein
MLHVARWLFAETATETWAGQLKRRAGRLWTSPGSRLLSVNSPFTVSTFTFGMVAILLPLLLLATSALARPSSRERLEARNAARNGQSVPRKPVQGFEALSAAAKSSNSTAESYSSNWAGAIYTWPHVRQYLQAAPTSTNMHLGLHHWHHWDVHSPVTLCATRWRLEHSLLWHCLGWHRWRYLRTSHSSKWRRLDGAIRRSKLRRYVMSSRTSDLGLT